jgi:hypothetical protein
MDQLVKMQFREALDLIDSMVVDRRGAPLDSSERVTLEAAWEDFTYEEAAKSSGYNIIQLQRGAGRELFILLTGLLGMGESITKKNFRRNFETRFSEEVQKTEDRTPALQAETVFTEVLGGELPDTSSFWGRANEIEELNNKVLTKRCIALVGLAGIGKSALAAKLLSNLSKASTAKFDRLVWKPIYTGSTFQSLVTDLIQLLQPDPEIPEALPEYTQARVSILLKYLTEYRHLVVLDALDSLLYTFSDDVGEQEELEVFLKRLAEERHQSCLLLTSREPLKLISRLQAGKRPVESLTLTGLLPKARYQILHGKGLSDKEDLTQVCAISSGNPLVLESFADIILNFWGGNVQNFLKFEMTPEVSVMREMLDQQFADYKRLGYLERRIMIYLASAVKDALSDITLSEMLDELKITDTDIASISNLRKAIDNLLQRSLIERRSDSKTGEAKFNIPPLIKQYILAKSAELVPSRN